MPAVEKDAFHVTVPPPVADKNARLFKLEFTAESADGTKRTKLAIPFGFNHSLKHANASKPSFCRFALDELGTGDVRFTVTPISCWGQRGKSISTVVKL